MKPTTRRTRRFKRYGLFLLVLLLPAFAVRAQQIEGVVQDANTTEPLVGATVQPVDATTGSGTVTDEEGRFVLNVSTPDPLEITVQYLGYQSVTLQARPGEDPLRIRLRASTILGDELLVRGVRADESSPIAYTTVQSEEIERIEQAQDLPYLLRSTPSVVTTSDAGAGVGYTSLRVRGVDQSRINVTLNGIPVNDGESQNVFWVNMPDLSSSVESIQVQRGVGTSTHGAGAFGATMSIQTGELESEPHIQTSSVLGSFNTRKLNLGAGTGTIGDGWNLQTRLSKIESDGYIDRGFSDLKSLHLSASRTGERGRLRMDVMTGMEKTYQAWNGVPEPILENDASELERYITNLGGDASHLRENLGNRRFNEFTYENQTDNYQQDHYHLHYSWQARENWILNSSLHYTRGRGYYEEYRTGDDLATYGIDPIQIGNETIEESDLVRQRWLDNHFYGVILSSQWSRNSWDLQVGGGYNEYDGDHFGEVIWARYAGESELGDHYYNNNGFKTDGNLYAKWTAYVTPDLTTFLDLQGRRVTYNFVGLRVEEVQGGQEVRDVEQQVDLHFFNPKAGITWQIDDERRAFASLSLGSREPGRRDYVESSPESRPSPERVFDYELGYEHRASLFRYGLNLYWMDYRDQLILTGAVNDVGAYVRENVEKSYRAGIELHGQARLTRSLRWDGSVTWSRNRIPEYQRYLDNFDQGGQDATVYEDTRIAFSPDWIGSTGLTLEQGPWWTRWQLEAVSRQYLDNTNTLSRSIDPYMVQHVSGGWRLQPEGWVQAVDVQIQLNNILNRNYVTNGYTFGWIAGGGEDHFNYFYPQAGRHASLKVSIEF
ncbi:MAG: TonB-dependent receptor [Bacteroidota bacterium]